MSERLCNRTACRKPGANWWNPSTRAYYCQACAMKINKHNPGLCVPPRVENQSLRLSWSDESEAEKWPEGCVVLSIDQHGRYEVFNHWRPDWCRNYYGGRTYSRLT